jgi:hypothetical protein
MMHIAKTRSAGALGALAAAAAVLHAPAASACAACFGKSDSALAEGMNWGIFALLGFISVVLAGFAGFGFYLAKKSAAASAPAEPPSKA